MKDRSTHLIWGFTSICAFGLGAVLIPSSGLVSDVSAGEPSANAADSSRLPADRRTAERDRPPADSPAGRNISKSAGVDLESLANQAFRDPDPIKRRLAFSKLLEAMTPENALRLRERLVEIGADGDQWRDFHYRWGAIAGQDAFEAATGMKERDLAGTMAGWASTNPAEAIDMLRNLPSTLEGQRAELTRGLVTGLASSDRAVASDFVLNLGKQGDKNAPGLMEIVANEAIRSDGPEAASQWSDSLPNGPLKGAAMGRIASGFVRLNPAAAAAWAQTHASEDYATRAIERISSGWTARAPQDAVRWLESLPPGNGQTAGLQTAFNDWEDRDPRSAADYLLSMPSSEQRDKSISGFANGYAWQDPQMAIQWANEIADPGIRERTVTWSGQIFFRQNPEAARTWLASSNLPAEVQEKILNPPRR